MEFKGTKGTWKMAGESQSGKSNFNIVGKRLGGKYKICRVPFMSKDEPITNYFDSRFSRITNVIKWIS